MAPKKICSALQAQSALLHLSVSLAVAQTLLLSQNDASPWTPTVGGSSRGRAAFS